MRNITLDHTLMDYLGGRPEPLDPDVHAWCLQAACFMWIDDTGRLWIRGKCYPEVKDPPHYSRLGIVHRCSEQLRFPGG